MSSPRGQTLQQRFGFSDDDLKSPAHDALMIWLVGQLPLLGERWVLPIYFRPDDIEKTRDQAARAVKNAIALCSNNITSLNNQKNWSDHISEIDIRIQAEQTRITEYQNWLGLGTPPQSSIDLNEIEWEKPIMSGQYMIGFVDLVAWYTRPALAIVGIDGRDNLLDREKLPTWVVYKEKVPVYFEAKTQIGSIGELIRQINMYRQYIKGKFVVVSPDDRCQDILASQHIEFLKAPM